MNNFFSAPCVSHHLITVFGLLMSAWSGLYRIKRDLWSGDSDQSGQKKTRKLSCRYGRRATAYTVYVAELIFKVIQSQWFSFHLKQRLRFLISD